jgi:site-specific DNA recombinase
MVNAAIYARVSQDEQAKGYSLPTQLDACQKYATDRNYRVIATFSEDFTGTKLDRPELHKLRDLVVAGGVERIIVYELDRFARGMAKQIILEEDFAKHGAIVEYVLADYDDTPEGRLQKNVRAVVAEYEREKIIERSKRGKRGRAKAGHVMPTGEISQYGYKYVPQPEGHGGAYVVVENEAKIVRLIFTWFTYGDENGKKLGSPRIARRLTEMGIPTRLDSAKTKRKKKKGRGVWSARTILSIIMAEIYTGVWYSGRTQTANGKTVKAPRENWIAVKVPAIVDRSVWEAAQAQRKINKVVSTRNTKGEYLMKSHIRCMKCGYTVTCVPADKRWRNASRRYRCQSFQRPPYSHLNQACNVSINSELVDTVVWNEISDRIKHPEKIIANLEKQKAIAEEMVQSTRDLLSIAEDRRAELLKQKGKLLDLYLGDQFSKDMLHGKMAEIQQQITKFDSEIADLQTQINGTPGITLNPQAIQAYLELIRTQVDNLTFDEKREILEVLDVRVVVEWQGKGQAILHVKGYAFETTLNTDPDDTNLMESGEHSIPSKMRYPFYFTVRVPPEQKADSR